VGGRGVVVFWSWNAARKKENETWTIIPRENLPVAHGVVAATIAAVADAAAHAVPHLQRQAHQHPTCKQEAQRIF